MGARVRNASVACVCDRVRFGADSQFVIAAVAALRWDLSRSGQRVRAAPAGRWTLRHPLRFWKGRCSPCSAKAANLQPGSRLFRECRSADTALVVALCFSLSPSHVQFLNVDDNIDLCAKEKSAKDPGLRADRDAGENGSALTEAEKSFQLVEAPGGLVLLRASEDYFVAVDPAEAKTKLVKNAVAAAHTVALAAAVAAAAASASASAAAAVAAAAAAASASASAATPAAAAASSSTGAAAASPTAVPASATPVGAATVSPPLPAAPLDFLPSPAELFVPVWLDNRSPLTLSGRVVVRTAHGKLWCAEPDEHGQAGAGAIVANRNQVVLWEPLTVLPQSLTHVAFLSVHGTFLSLLPPSGAAAAAAAASGGASAAAIPRPQDQTLLAFTPPNPSGASPAGGELFEVVEVDKRAGRFAFRAANGLFLCAQGNYQVTASSRQCGPWEQFQLIPWPHMP